MFRSKGYLPTSTPGLVLVWATKTQRGRCCRSDYSPCHESDRVYATKTQRGRSRNLSLSLSKPSPRALSARGCKAAVRMWQGAGTRGEEEAEAEAEDPGNGIPARDLGGRGTEQLRQRTHCWTMRSARIVRAENDGQPCARRGTWKRGHLEKANIRLQEPPRGEARLFLLVVSSRERRARTIHGRRVTT